MRDITEPIAAAPSNPAGAGGRDLDGAATLSQREQEVLRLVATGCTDRQIAEALFVSRHTVGNHVRHILAKLDVATRAAAVAAAARMGAL
ncbi:MAG TPA: helix-turn-helix transcriptional regulator [Thermomicrobiales bacterium]|nr:helix-turn-helix transcriptional regulator [Thermomicrobiales bacterium]